MVIEKNSETGDGCHGSPMPGVSKREAHSITTTGL